MVAKRELYVVDSFVKTADELFLAVLLMVVVEKELVTFEFEGMSVAEIAEEDLNLLQGLWLFCCLDGRDDSIYAIDLLQILVVLAVYLPQPQDLFDELFI